MNKTIFLKFAAPFNDLWPDGIRRDTVWARILDVDEMDCELVDEAGVQISGELGDGLVETVEIGADEARAVRHML